MRCARLVVSVSLAVCLVETHPPPPHTLNTHTHTHTYTHIHTSVETHDHMAECLFTRVSLTLNNHRYKLNQEKLLSQRTQLYWNHSGMWTTETSHLTGAYCPRDYGCSGREGYPVWLETSGFVSSINLLTLIKSKRKCVFYALYAPRKHITCCFLLISFAGSFCSYTNTVMTKRFLGICMSTRVVTVARASTR